MDRYQDLYPFYYLSTCALAESQAKTKIEMIYSRKFMIYIVEKSTSFMAPLPGINQ